VIKLFIPRKVLPESKLFPSNEIVVLTLLFIELSSSQLLRSNCQVYRAFGKMLVISLEVKINLADVLFCKIIKCGNDVRFHLGPLSACTKGIKFSCVIVCRSENLLSKVN